MTTPYARRRIELSFQLGTGESLKVVSGADLGFRIHAHIEFANAPTTGNATVRIFGLNLDHMNQLAKAGLVFEAPERQSNTISIRAGDDQAGMSTVFNGVIIEAYPDFRTQPEVSFYIFATPTPIIQLKPVEPTTFKDSVSAETAATTIAQKAGLMLENNGVNAILASPYFPGTAWRQILGLINAADCFGFVDGIAKKLALWPKTGSRSGDLATISPETGMIGYPSFQQLRVNVRVLFAPESSGIQPGKKISIQSQLPAANGTFTVTNMVHELMSEMPDGPWESIVEAVPLQQVNG